MFLSKTLYLLLSTGSNQEDMSQHDLKNCLLRSKASNEKKKLGVVISHCQQYIELFPC